MAKGEPVSLDTSVIIAALLSSTGASFYVLAAGKAEKYYLECCDYVLEEVNAVLINKFSKRPELNAELHTLMALGDVDVTPTPSTTEFRKLYDIIERKDAPILAAALKHPGHLLTLDKDFLSEEVRKYAKNRRLTISTPGEFIRKNSNT
ncbi:MAG: putative toxin-antitoxin system toxin component, PIN family [Candidatus Andersenbacteria bacterium CG10_big_fil_rev_8_21_14_0_10_54_11]|uniref:Putative toxin-antitoxin system toxin component, PIN family n=1 Tax=Candidatus Andersenbacteria bacterium CG10_big_fil_rev_8_21_14_0_10_54_11 TaxID=1974485 RepID=A0A2M6WZC8_9BACT|nr:MAG: putative toxin-antitoxin system toxin component, PIN family [Candidatus Andersenbacteria bacterium CG10_big_fil_rev_8_21_14_0_10_54_11]